MYFSSQKCRLKKKYFTHNVRHTVRYLCVKSGLTMANWFQNMYFSVLVSFAWKTKTAIILGFGSLNNIPTKFQEKLVSKFRRKLETCQFLGSKIGIFPLQWFLPKKKNKTVIFLGLGSLNISTCFQRKVMSSLEESCVTN